MMSEQQHQPVERPVVTLEEPRTHQVNPPTAAELAEQKQQEAVRVQAAFDTQQKKQLHARIERDFRYYAPTGPDQIAVYAEIRDGARVFAHNLVTLCPHSRELSTALTLLEQAVMMANASVAREGA